MVSLSSSPPKTAPSTPRVATRRVSRFSPRPFSSPLAAVRNVGRPPIVLEWGSSVIRVGYAEQFQPQHIIPLSQKPFLKLEAYKTKKTPEGWVGEEESRWYNLVSPIIRNVFDRLMLDPTTRRVVVVASPYPLRAWESAIKEALWNLGVPAVTFLNYLEVVPLAQGWSRGLVIHVGNEESHFLAHVDGHPLPFTYQGMSCTGLSMKSISSLLMDFAAVPCGYKTAVEDATRVSCKWDEKMEKAWLDENNPSSLLSALLKCLEECPTDARKDVIGNLLVCGDTVLLVPDLSRRLALKVKAVLSANTNSEDSSPIEETSDLTIVPMTRKALKPLAEHVGLLSCAPHRPDLISWVGGSIYSTIWHRHDDQDSHVRWSFSPASAAE